MHVLAFSQGVAALSHAFRDEAHASRAVERTRDWLSTYTK